MGLANSPGIQPSDTVKKIWKQKTNLNVMKLTDLRRTGVHRTRLAVEER